MEDIGNERSESSDRYANSLVMEDLMYEEGFICFSGAVSVEVEGDEAPIGTKHSESELLTPEVQRSWVWG